MLPRSLSEIYDVIRNFWVVEKEGKIVGSAAVSICWEDIAEIRSLAVAEEVQKQGVEYTCCHGYIIAWDRCR